MTKWGGFAFGPRGHHRADVHRGIVDDATINEPCGRLTALSKGQVTERGVPAVAQRRNLLSRGRHIAMLLGLGIKLPQWLPHALLGLCHLLPSALELLALD